jgi:hypothetical protein
MDINKFRPLLLVPIALVSTSKTVYAIIYVDLARVQHLIFPHAKMSPVHMTLSDDQAKEIEHLTGVNVRDKELKVWKVATGGWFIVDEVIGKHEFITYAIGLDAKGSVKQIEIMNYKESYGYEVGRPAWRKQFAGKKDGAPLTLGSDIQNISGATLSCRHIADGVKRVLATYTVALKGRIG